MAPPLDWLVRALADRLGRLERRISLKGGAEGHALIRRHGQAFGAAWEAAGTILQASATADLTLTTSAQSIVGDGDSTKVRVLLPTPGDWNISAAFDLNHTVLGGVEAVGQLHVNDSASAETGAALLRDSSGQATVYQHWKVTTTVADTPVELKARKNTAAGTAYAMQTNTRLIASGGNGGGGGSGSGTDANAIHDNVSSEISAITEKASPVSADLIVIEDSAASNAKKRVQVGNLPGATHNLLDGSTHPDTVAQTVSRGSIPYGNSTPAWDELALGQTGQFPRSDGTDIDWDGIRQNDARGQGGPHLGHSRTESTMVQCGANQVNVFGPYKLLADMTVASGWAQLRITAGSGTCRMVIYQDNGSGVPSTLIDTSDEATITDTGATGSWKEFPFTTTPPSLAAQTSYWVGIISNSSNIQMGMTSATTSLRLVGDVGHRLDTAVTYPTPDDPFTDDSNTVRVGACYVEGSSGGGSAHGIAAHTEHGNWKVMYTDGSGDEQELALGADGTVLTSTGASTAPAFEAAAGGTFTNYASIWGLGGT